jgi:hypothetical protein
MWLTFIVTAVIALPTFALAWQYSPHKSGTTHDADFWFLVQTCSMQLLGLLIMAIPMWEGKELSGHSWYWTWGFILVAFGGTITAPFVYCHAPTEWSSFLGIVAGAVQAFVTLQVTLIANGVEKGLKKVLNEAPKDLSPSSPQNTHNQQPRIEPRKHIKRRRPRQIIKQITP